MSIAVLTQKMLKEMSFSERECVKLGTLQLCSLKEPQDLGDSDAILVQFKDYSFKNPFKNIYIQKNEGG